MWRRFYVPPEQMAAARRQLSFSPRQALAQAGQAPTASGQYRIFRNGGLIYVGESANLRTRLMQHLWCLTHLQIPVAPYQFSYALMSRSTPASRRRVERAAIERHRRRLPQQRELEAQFEQALFEFELEQAAEALYEAEQSGCLCPGRAPALSR
jgi:hypothetical protein